ncbi:ROK family transcriptional regulator [Agromyces bracchium]|uniref:ROK family protein n=1 Tax=Agromyces bracchium TaxID=88376 RepID=A0A6I3M4L0_9MICO|nr:ROK family transcriptional regulator [Agromyces bracchium]MTH67831.1 ROK family protein [Agromyces bracchium]
MTQPGATAAHDPSAHDPSESTAANQAGRAEHAGRLVDHLFAHGSATRAELAGATGLGRTAVSGLVARLIEAGVLVEPGGDHARHGRLRLGIADRLLLTAGVAGDDAVATLSELDGTETARYEEPVAIADDDPRPASAAPLDALAVVVDRAIAQAEREGHDIADVTLLVQGAVVGAPALAIGDATLGLEPLDVVAALRARSDRLAGIEPDLVVPPTLRTTASARAASEAGDGTGHLDEVVLHISGDAQVSAAIVIRGEPYSGAHGLAGTFGHLPIVPNGIRCECGQRGCLATVAAPDVVLAKAELQDFELTYGRKAAIAELEGRIADSEDRARWAWLDAALWIGRALQVVVPAIDPDVVIVGGWWAPLVADIDASFRDNRPTVGNGALNAIPRLTAGRPGDDLGLEGARRQARDGLRSVLASAVA